MEPTADEYMHMSKLTPASLLDSSVLLRHAVNHARLVTCYAEAAQTRERCHDSGARTVFAKVMHSGRLYTESAASNFISSR